MCLYLNCVLCLNLSKLSLYFCCRQGNSRSGAHFWYLFICLVFILSYEGTSVDYRPGRPTHPPFWRVRQKHFFDFTQALTQITIRRRSVTAFWSPEKTELELSQYVASADKVIHTNILENFKDFWIQAFFNVIKK